jgi:hypothetical protein
MVIVSRASRDILKERNAPYSCEWPYRCLFRGTGDYCPSEYCATIYSCNVPSYFSCTVQDCDQVFTCTGYGQ